MRITVAYNLRTELTEEQAELLLQDDVDRLVAALRDLKHKVTPVEVSGNPERFVSRLIDSEPDLIFNVAEGHVGSAREAFYPGVYEQLGIPFTGGNASLLHMNLDKNLAKTVLAQRGVRVPRGVLVRSESQPIPPDLDYPLIIKPNAEGSSKGITQDSIVESLGELRDRLHRHLRRYPAGLIVEEFITGRELSVPLLEAYPGKILGMVEHFFNLEALGVKYNIYDYDMKQGGESSRAVTVECPPVLTPQEEQACMELAHQAFSVMDCPDFGRVDLRLREDGVPFFLELNPLPSLHPNGSLMTAGRSAGLEYRDVIRLVVRSAARRHNLSIRAPRKSDLQKVAVDVDRPTVRECGIRIGRFEAGPHNAITDVKGVRVGHVTTVRDDVKTPGVPGSSTIRTGVTAIIPAPGDYFHRRLVAGGFILNGVGEMSGLTQLIEWGWLETPILLTNSLSVGRVHAGVINHMIGRYPELGTKTDVALPVVGETDDSFLNDVQIGFNTAQDAIRAIENARGGDVVQGSVGAGTGMTSFDFAGGIGTSSRLLNLDGAVFTLGVLVLSNFGRMRNLTVDGCVVGRDLDPMFDLPRRTNSYGSVIVVLATNAPLLSSQLNRLAKRCALGLGRAGSHAAASSGEIIVAFSTANRLPRVPAKPARPVTLRFIADAFINEFYEAAIEATEEAVLNAVFCSSGMTGREGRLSPPIPQEKVLEILSRGVTIHASH